MLIFLCHFIYDPKSWNSDDHSGVSYYLPFNENGSKIKLIYCYTTILVGCAFQSIFFPIINSLKDNTKPGIMKTCFTALSTVATIYTGWVFISVYSFGDSIKSDVLTNIGDNQGWITIVLWGLFSIIASLHVPLIFYVGKDALLIMIFTTFYVKTENKEKVQNLRLQANRSKSLQMSTIRFEILGEFESERNTCDANHFKSNSILKRRDIIPNIDKCIANQVLSLSNANPSVITMNDRNDAPLIKKPQNELSQNDLPFLVYYPITLLLFWAEITVASLVDDVSIVFGFIGALSISMLFFHFTRLILCKISFIMLER